MEGGGEEVTIGRVVMSRIEKLKYLGSTINERGDIDDDINYCIRVR